jgi:hypothetical protein
MSLIFFEGFDFGVGAITPYSGHLNMYGWLGDAKGTFTTGRYGGGAVYNFSGSVEFTSKSTIVLNFGLKAQAGGQSATNSWIQFIDSTVANTAPTVQCGIGIDANNKLFVTRGDTTILGTSNYAFPVNQWVWVSFKTTFGSGTSGSMTLYINGTQKYVLSGINNIVTANATANRIRFWNRNSNNFTIDDLIINDTSGGTLNDNLTNRRVTYSYPNAAGDSTTWSSTGTNWTVAGYRPDLYVTAYIWDKYNYSSTVGAVDLYNHDDNYSTKSSTIYEYVKLTTLCTKMSAGPRKMKPLLKINGTIYELTEVNVPNGWRAIQQTMSVNPATNLPFTGPDLNAIQTGLKITV